MSTSSFDAATDRAIEYALTKKVSVFVGLPFGAAGFSFIRAETFKVGWFTPEIEITPDGHVYAVNLNGERTT